jgi:anti-sigma factor (TIGR02949 family)
MKHEHTMKCQDILQSLSEYIDGELEARLCSEIEAHIASCPDCKIVVDTLKKTIRLYQISGREIQVPEDVQKRLYSRLNLDDYAQKR